MLHSIWVWAKVRVQSAKINRHALQLCTLYGGGASRRVHFAIGFPGKSCYFIIIIKDIQFTAFSEVRNKHWI